MGNGAQAHGSAMYAPQIGHSFSEPDLSPEPDPVEIDHKKRIFSRCNLPDQDVASRKIFVQDSIVMYPFANPHREGRKNLQPVGQFKIENVAQAEIMFQKQGNIIAFLQHSVVVIIIDPGDGLRGLYAHFDKPEAIVVRSLGLGGTQEAICQLVQEMGPAERFYTKLNASVMDYFQVIPAIFQGIAHGAEVCIQL